MANEQNYKIVMLHNDNDVGEEFACPVCHNVDVDTLAIIDSEVIAGRFITTVECQECGKVYQI